MFPDCGLEIQIPGTCSVIRPGCRIRLGRFNSTEWLALHGWYSFGGNRPCCGWYLTKVDDSSVVKPLQLTDLDDCYLVEY